MLVLGGVVFAVLAVLVIGVFARNWRRSND
jgi:hypothetical protein